MANVFDVVFDHDHAFDAAAPGEAGIFLCVNASHFQHIWMNHATAEQFQPAFAADVAAGFIAKRAGDSELKAWLGEREIERLGPNLHFFAEISFKKCLQNRYQMAGIDSFVDVNPLQLVKSMLVPGVDIFVAKHSSWDDVGDRLTKV